MARLRCHGSEVKRLVKDGFAYVFMSDGKVLKGGSGRYKLVKLKPSKTTADLERGLLAAGYQEEVR